MYQLIYTGDINVTFPLILSALKWKTLQRMLSAGWDRNIKGSLTCETLIFDLLVNGHSKFKFIHRLRALLATLTHTCHNSFSVQAYIIHIFSVSKCIYTWDIETTFPEPLDIVRHNRYAWSHFWIDLFPKNDCFRPRTIFHFLAGLPFHFFSIFLGPFCVQNVSRTSYKVAFPWRLGSIPSKVFQWRIT